MRWLKIRKFDTDLLITVTFIFLSKKNNHFYFVECCVHWFLLSQSWQAQISWGSRDLWEFPPVTVDMGLHWVTNHLNYLDFVDKFARICKWRAIQWTRSVSGDAAMVAELGIQVEDANVQQNVQQIVPTQESDPLAHYQHLQ